MEKLIARLPRPPAAGLVRALRFCAAALLLHGVLLGVFVAAQSLASEGLLDDAPDLAQAVGFFVISVPAIILTRPVTPLLWYLGLMNAPGWFAWPKPLGVALAYALWIAAFLALAEAVRWWYQKR